MPRAAPRPCTHPGCGTLVDSGGRCDKHRKQVEAESRQRRGTRTERGYSNAWLKAREAYLRKHPLCRAHEAAGMLVPATEVDHIKPHRGDMTIFWDSSNWQPLCKSCHSHKTATEDGGFGRGFECAATYSNKS